MKELLSILLAALLALSVCAFGEGSYDFIGGNYRYRLLEDGTAEIISYLGDAVLPGIPYMLGGARVTAIGGAAFSQDRELKSIIIPDRVTTVGINPFIYCTKLNRIVISSNHPTLKIIDGVLFSREDQRLICYPGGFQGTTYVIPQGTEVIGDGAFASNEFLEAVAIPDSVWTVGINPFMYCTKLKQIDVPADHPTLENIGGALFSKEDKQLICYPCAFEQTSYEVPQGTEIIGEGAFVANPSLTIVTLPDGVTTICNGAFTDCGSLTTVIIPDSVTNIGDEAFTNCEKLILSVSSDSYAKEYAVANGLRTHVLVPMD